LRAVGASQPTSHGRRANTAAGLAPGTARSTFTPGSASVGWLAPTRAYGERDEQGHESLPVTKVGLVIGLVGEEPVEGGRSHVLGVHLGPDAGGKRSKGQAGELVGVAAQDLGSRLHVVGLRACSDVVKGRGRHG